MPDERITFNMGRMDSSASTTPGRFGRGKGEYYWMGLNRKLEVSSYLLALQQGSRRLERSISVHIAIQV